MRLALARSPGRRDARPTLGFMGSLHLLSHTHWDHELVRPRSRPPPRPRKRPDRMGRRGRKRGGGRVARFRERNSRLTLHLAKPAWAQVKLRPWAWAAAARHTAGWSWPRARFPSGLEESPL